jgi:hypothetical protein
LAHDGTRLICQQLGQALRLKSREASDKVTDRLGGGQFHLFLFRARSDPAHAPSIGAPAVTPRTSPWSCP